MGAAICSGSVRSALGRCLALRRDVLVGDEGLARHAVEFVGDGPAAVLVRLADVDQPDDQRLAFFDRDADFLAVAAGRRKMPASAAR